MKYVQRRSHVTRVARTRLLTSLLLRRTRFMKDGGALYSSPASAASSQRSAGQGQVLVGTSLLFRQIISVIDAVACNDCIVLLEGESGTGKELLARRIHHHSRRVNGPFVPVNCPGISPTLFESQFYGHVKGAFTGAASDTLGVVRAADKGTLLLDEVGELDLHLQPKLLRLLQEREVIPLGASRPVSVDVRFVAATNRSLAKSVAEGLFRSDLYHRLNVVRIEIPPLRSRPDDVDPLVRHFIDYFAQQYRMPPRQISQGLMKCLSDYHWPGNVRELAGYVERLYAANLPPMPPGLSAWDDGYKPAKKLIEAEPGRMPLTCDSPPDKPCCTLAEAEARAIRHALEIAGFNRSLAARMLEIHRSTLLRKIRSLRMDP